MNDWDDADRHAERAERYYRAGQWERALHELQEALEHRPEEGDWHYGLGLTLEAMKRYDEAAEAFGEALRLRGEDVGGLLHQGVDLIRAGQPRPALDVLARVNELDPAEPLGYVHRVLALVLLGEHDEAEVMFYLARQATGRSCDHEQADPAPETPDRQARAIAYEYLAQSRLLQDDETRAEWCWQETLRLDPTHPEANRSLAVLYRQQGEFGPARRHYRRQLRLDPDQIETRLEFGELLLARHRLAEATKQFREVLDRDPTVAPAHLRLGDLAVINGYYAAAADRYEHARQLDPGLPGVYLGLARLALRQDEPVAARAWLKQELQLEGQNAEQVVDLGELLVEADLPHETVRLLTPLLNGADDLLMHDDDAYSAALTCRGDARSAEGATDEALADYLRSLKLRPDAIGPIRRVASLYLDTGDLEAARGWIRLGLEQQPTNTQLTDLRHRLGRASRRQAVRRWLRVFRRPAR
jgi:Tfp pilus assembly protein PilF